MSVNIILTGAPGAGKTSIIRQLELEGIDVVEEAATDVIALEQALGIEQPWLDHGFTGRIARLQLLRQGRQPASAVRVFDRSPICTLALAEYLGHPVPPLLRKAVENIVAAGTYEKRVVLVELLGFITPTAARRISYADSQRFEAFHVAAYERFGFELVRLPPASIDERAAAVRRILAVPSPG